MSWRVHRAPPRSTLVLVDPLRRDDIDRAVRTPPEEKARQALEMMAFGIELQRRKLRQAHPGATDIEIDALLRAWLAREA